MAEDDPQPAPGAAAIDFGALLAVLPDAVAVLGPDGMVVWANEACARLLGTPLERLVGDDGLGRLHPDEVPRALDGIAWAVAFPDRTAVVPYRLRRDDGSYVSVELMSTVTPTAAGDCLVMMVRDGTTRTTLAAALASVAEGAPIDETALWLVDAIESRWPHTIAAVVHAEEGVRQVTTRSLPPDLIAPLTRVAGPDEHADLRPPWEVARSSNGIIVAEGDDLPADLRSIAAAHGLRGCAVVAAHDPDGERACVVAWFDEPDAARLEWPHWADEVGGLLGLALERRSHQNELWERARRDPLTGLPNRIGFQEAAGTLVDSAGAAGDELTVLYIDLDGFKPVNDELGHSVGDRVLGIVAARLADAAGGQLTARIGGDEFIVAMVTATGDHRAPEDVADRILDALQQPIAVQEDGRGHAVQLSASIGIAPVPLGEHDRSITQAIRTADAAMYAAKRSGRGRWQRAD